MLCNFCCAPLWDVFYWSHCQAASQVYRGFELKSSSQVNDAQMCPTPEILSAKPQEVLVRDALHQATIRGPVSL